MWTLKTHWQLHCGLFYILIFLSALRKHYVILFFLFLPRMGGKLLKGTAEVYAFHIH